MADLKNANSGYPTAIDTASAYVDNVDRYTAGVVNRILSAVLAIEGELGISPSGSQSTLLDRLAICLGTNGGLNSGTSFPLAPVDGQLFRRTDYSPPKIYQYQSSGASWALISTDAATLGGLSASTTPTASTIPVSDGSNKLALGWLPTSVTGAQDKVPTQSSGTRLDKTWMPSETMYYDGYLVYDSGVLGAAVTTQSITGLDINTHLGYVFEFQIDQTTVSSPHMRSWFNPGTGMDTTAGNYYYYDRLNSGTAAGADGIMSYAVPATSQIVINGFICRLNNGKIILQHISHRPGNNDSTGGVTRTATSGTNLTAIDIVSSVASGIGIGSRFRVWRRR